LHPSQRETLLGLAHNVVVSDGLLDPNEEGMLDEFKREMGLSSDLESSYIELIGVDEVFDSEKSRRIALLNLLLLSYADGAFEIEEECFLKELSKLFEVDDREFVLLESWARRFHVLEQEAKNIFSI
tara:strand:- start:311 stop:691 length:381 start_codon:yes stop_codon:yes gene_type:complete